MRLTTGLMLAAVLLNTSSLPSVAGETAASSSLSARKSARRLPTEVMPVSYDLKLNPNLQANTFSGHETIELKVTKPVSRILLNAKDLTITGASIITGSGSKAQKLKIQMLPNDEMVSFENGNTFQPGQHKLQLDYNSKFNDKLVGFYKATFKDNAGKQHTLATTQFEPADARRMLPCFDEPQMKARFKIAVQANKGFSAVSNAPVEKEIAQGGGTKLIQFAATPPMSSYLLALVVGELEATPPVVVQGVPVRVWSVAGRAKLGTFSRDTAAKLLPALTAYFGIDYPWTKLDLLAIPDFEAGAMENPGCITFRETLLLIDPKTASSHTLRGAASVIAHEMAHLWFGDLVTMQWWDDLWLNEAFATWMSTRAVNTVFPEWDFWKDYIEARSAALHTDSLHSTRSIHSPVLSPDQATEMFDVITYEKGASVLRMLERYVGESKFQEGIHKYLKEHSFANATTNDLWEAIGSVSGVKVKELMNGWVHQPGYPILTLQHQPDSKTRIVFSQQRFFLAGPDASNKSAWEVPIGIRPLSEAPATNNQTAAKSNLMLNGAMKAFDEPVASSPFIANSGGVGYYRLRYPQADAQAIQSQIETQLDPGERLSILDDTWNLSLSGQLPIQQYLEMLPAYKNETDDLVWQKIIDSLDSLDYFVADSTRPDFQRFVQRTLAPIQQKLGWQAQPGESQRRKMLRGSVIEELGTIGQDAAVIKGAREMFKTYLKDKSKVDPDLVSPVSGIVAYNGNSADYETFKRLYKVASTPEEEHRNLFLLPEFIAPNLVAGTMTMATSGTIRIQDAPRLLGAMLSQRRTSAAAWQFIQKNWSRITKLYAEPMVPGIVARASCFNTPAQYQQFKTFVATHPMPSGQTQMKRALETAQINVGFRQRSAKSLNDWLRQQ